jgi:hypothetical protein
MGVVMTGSTGWMWRGIGWMCAGWGLGCGIIAVGVCAMPIPLAYQWGCIIAGSFAMMAGVVLAVRPEPEPAEPTVPRPIMGCPICGRAYMAGCESWDATVDAHTDVYGRIVRG